MIKVSAPGKLHLIGEHAVVYGKPAIIAAIGRRFYVEAEKSKDVSVEAREIPRSVTYSTEEVVDFAGKVQERWEDCFPSKDFSKVFALLKEDEMNPIKAAIGKAMISLGVSAGVNIKAYSDIPIGAGLGSSSAMGVTVTKALAEINGIRITDEKINKIAIGIENFNHGTTSGGDPTAVQYGGLLWFQKGEPNIIKPLRVPKLENFVLVYVKKPDKGTGEMVQQVGNLDEEYRAPRIEALGKATEEMLTALKAQDYEKIMKLINAAQDSLRELGVSCKEVDELAEAVRRAGGAAKLCGAGGGGVVLCYHKDKKNLGKVIKSLDYNPWDVALGAEGVRVDK